MVNPRRCTCTGRLSGQTSHASFWPKAAVAAEVHRRADALEADVRAMHSKGRGQNYVDTTIANLAEQMGILSPDMVMQKRLAQARGANGWKRVQAQTVGGTRERVWVPS